VLTADLSLPSSPSPLFLSLSAWLDETITTGYQLVTHGQLSLTVNRPTGDGYVYPVGLNCIRMRLAADADVYAAHEPMASTNGSHIT